jgi:hypothetical protein
MTKRGAGQGSTWAGRRIATLGLIVLVVATTGLAQSASGHQLKQRRQHVHNTTYLHLVGPPGVEIFEEGKCVGTYPGTGKSHLKFSGGHLSGTWSLATDGGTVRGRTNGKVTGPSARPLVRFAGAVTITGGTGKFVNASGTLRLTGTLRRSNYAIVEETSGQVRF